MPTCTWWNSTGDVLWRESNTVPASIFEAQVSKCGPGLEPAALFLTLLNNSGTYLDPAGVTVRPILLPNDWDSPVSHHFCHGKCDGFLIRRLHMIISSTGLTFPLRCCEPTLTGEAWFSNMVDSLLSCARETIRAEKGVRGICHWEDTKHEAVPLDERPRCSMWSWLNPGPLPATFLPPPRPL